MRYSTSTVDWGCVSLLNEHTHHCLLFVTRSCIVFFFLLIARAFKRRRSTYTVTLCCCLDNDVKMEVMHCVLLILTLSVRETIIKEQSTSAFRSVKLSKDSG